MFWAPFLLALAATGGRLADDPSPWPLRRKS
jgi:hypothetical protein